MAARAILTEPPLSAGAALLPDPVPPPGAAPPPDAKTICCAYLTVENNLPIGSAGSRPVKYNQSTDLFKANSAEAPAKISITVSACPQIRRTIDSFFKACLLRALSTDITDKIPSV